MKTLKINYKTILSKLNLEALRRSPNGDLFTGYQILNNKKFKVLLDADTAIYITPRLESEIKMDIKVTWKQADKIIENFNKDIEISFEE